MSELQVRAQNILLKLRCELAIVTKTLLCDWQTSGRWKKKATRCIQVQLIAVVINCALNHFQRFSWWFYSSSCSTVPSESNHATKKHE